MIKFKHTPGPWEVNIYNGHHVISPKNGRTIASCNIPNHKANAHLIAAAPEMLEALIEIWKYHLENREAMPWEIKAIIEKATGLPIEEVLNDD